MQQIRVAPVQNSSPVTSNTDPTELLHEYVSWHIQKTPGYERQFKEAFNALKQECYDIEFVWKLHATDWKDLMVPLGVGQRLSREVRDFLAVRAKQRENSVFQTSQALQALQEDEEEDDYDVLRERARATIESITP
jgi:hypothetical protein